MEGLKGKSLDSYTKINLHFNEIFFLKEKPDIGNAYESKFATNSKELKIP